MAGSAFEDVIHLLLVGFAARCEGGKRYDAVAFGEPYRAGSYRPTPSGLRCGMTW